MDTAIKKGTTRFKSCYEKVVHKTAEATREFIGNKIAKSKSVPDVEERVVPPEKREDVSNELRQLF